MRSARPWSLVITLVGVLLAQSALGSSEDQRATLRHLSGLSVGVSISCDRPEFTALVDSAGLVTKLELELRRASVKIYTVEALKTAQSPGILTLEIDAVPSSSQTEGAAASPLSYAISVRLYVTQVLWVVKKGLPVQMLLAEGWSKGLVLNYGTTTLQKGILAKDITDLADELANDWLAAHGR